MYVYIWAPAICFDVCRLIGDEDFELRPCQKFSGYSYMDQTGSRKAGRRKPEAGPDQQPEARTLYCTVFSRLSGIILRKNNLVKGG